MAKIAQVFSVRTSDATGFLWAWRCCRGSAHSHSNFLYFYDCVEDARRAGYGIEVADASRKSDHRKDRVASPRSKPAGRAAASDRTAALATREDCVSAARAARIYDEPHEGLCKSRHSPLADAAILCVQSDAALQRFLQHNLECAKITLALTGREALAISNRTAFDAYMLDYWFPDWSGVSFCRYLRKADPHVPICFFGNARSDDAVRRALGAGADLVVPAPAEPQALRLRLETLILWRASHLLRARSEVERAVQGELERRGDAARAMCADRRHSVATALERTARANALQAFVAAGGTRSAFSRTWTQLYSSACSAFGVPFYRAEPDTSHRKL